MIEWSTIVIAIAGSISIGEIISLFTVKEHKKGMKIENKQKEDERWEKLADQLQDQVEKLQNQIESLNNRLEAKDARIIELEDRCASLQEKLDTSRTQCSIATMLRCNKISCTDRVPPISEAFTGDISRQLTDYIEKM